MEKDLFGSFALEIAVLKFSWGISSFNLISEKFLKSLVNFVRFRWLSIAFSDREIPNCEKLSLTSETIFVRSKENFAQNYMFHSEVDLC